MQTSNSLSSYFRTEVDYAVRTEGLKTGELTETYLAQLLADYAAQPVNHEPLTLRLMEAMSEPPREQRQHLREIGDTSLFVSGFWGESLERKWVDVDYYIGMGGSAYERLSRLTRSNEPYSAVFAELASNFDRFVEVLMTVRQRTTRSRNPSDLLRLYERWMRTRSRWAGRRLAEAGVLPPTSRTPRTIQ